MCHFRSKLKPATILLKSASVITNAIVKAAVDYRRVFLAAIAANLSSLACGTCIGWASPMFPKLKSNVTTDSPLVKPIVLDDERWIASTMAIGAAFTPFIAGPLADKIGRKLVLLYSASFFIAAYVLMIFATKIWILLLARLVKGFGIGFSNAVLPMYLGEIATDNVRGAVGSLMPLFIGLGVFLTVCIGPFVSYYGLQYFCLAVPIVFVFVFSFMPESPHFYVAHHNPTKASHALMFLRGQNRDEIEQEQLDIERIIQNSIPEGSTFKHLVMERANRRALMMCLGAMGFQQLSGIDPVTFNTQSIFDSANTSIEGSIATIIVNGVALIFSIFVPLIADRLGRKALLLISAFFTGIGLALLGLFFFMKNTLGIKNSIDWLPLPSFLLYIITYVLGIGPVPWVITSEMFAPSVKPLATSMVASLCWIGGFVGAFSFPYLEHSGVYYAFWLFGVCCFPLAFLFTLFFIIETKGLSLLEIQDRLQNAKLPSFNV